MIEGLFAELTVWHWLGLAFLLLGVEMMIGTFDLLWVAIAAGATALFASIAPDDMSGWVHQAIFFAVTAVILVALGRTVFSGKRAVVESHPTLNDRNAALIGQRAVVTNGFEDGYGRVKINDSEWRAELDAVVDIGIGDPVIVVSANGSTVRVRAV